MSGDSSSGRKLVRGPVTTSNSSVNSNSNTPHISLRTSNASSIPYVAPRLAVASDAPALAASRGTITPVVSPRLSRDVDAGSSAAAIAKDTISPNITPRSHVRRARVDNSASSVQSTPTSIPLHTPVSSKPLSVVTPSLPQKQNQAQSQINRATRSQSAVSSRGGVAKSPMTNGNASGLSGLHGPSGMKDVSAQFFLASDGPQQSGGGAMKRSKSPGGSSTQGVRQGLVRSSTANCFFYADGQEETISPVLDPTRQRSESRASRSPGPKERELGPDMSFSSRRRMASRSPSTTSQARFPATGSHTSLAPLAAASNVRSPPKTAPAAVAEHMSPPSARLADSAVRTTPRSTGNTTTTASPPRLSPPNAATTVHLQARTSPELRILSRTIRGAAPRSKSPLKKFGAGNQSVAHSQQTSSRRRSSIDSSAPGSRQVSGASNKTNANIDTPRTSSTSKHGKSPSTSSAESLGKIPPDMVQSAPTLPGLVSPSSPSSPIRPLIPTRAAVYTVPSSPVKANGEANEVSETIHDARRERKILDLEISNSSLLVFNRSLERDNRRMKAEMRRLRRVTAASAFSATSVSTYASTTDSLDVRLEDEEDGTGVRVEWDSESDEDEDQDSTDGGSAAAELQRARDERRLRRDFSKHRQLLEDSRAMNTSIKHCLDLTDWLIEEGKKALQYEYNHEEHGALRVLGPRVLHNDEEEEDGEGFAQLGRGLLSPVSEVNIAWNAPTRNSGEVALEGIEESEEKETG